jgi:NAD-dependent dihydropyrimidine dehydrogenase PreA subunit
MKLNILSPPGQQINTKGNDVGPERKKIDPYIIWVANYCKHCFTCVAICPVDNLFFDEDEMASRQKCIQCQLCMKYCPDFSLEVVPRKKVTSKISKEKKAKSTQRKKTCQKLIRQSSRPSIELRTTK